MIYQEFPVPPALQDYLLCFWKFTGPDRIQGGSLQHFIMPDASSSLIFFVHPPDGYLGSGLIGPTKYIRETEVFEKAVTIGIRFKPGLTSKLFGISGLELRDNRINPAPELPHFDHARVLDQLGKKNEVWSYFREQLPLSMQALTPEPHPAVARALKLILDSKGNLKMSELTQRVPLSERQLQKVFKREIGLTPKEFATVMRLRDAIIQMELEQKDYQDTVFDAGYYDQAHFIRDFSKLSKISLPAFKKYISNIRHIDVIYRR
jgi:AraC-like DNA-binding protein